MELVLFRHGIAIDRDDPRCPSDPERALTPKGVRRTRRAALGLRETGVRPDTILSSPWVRAVETARLTADAFGLSPADIVESEDLLPSSDPARLLASLDAGSGTVLVAGHAPHLDLLLSAALGHPGGPLRTLGKAGAAAVELDAPGEEPGRLRWFFRPRELRRLASTRD